MAIWEITFYFKNCSPKVLVEADTEEAAIDKAREQDWPHVPQYIKATSFRMGRGGARPGSGAKKGVPRIKNRRTVKKTILWSPVEWEEIKAKAQRKRMKVSDYQRALILGS